MFELALSLPSRGSRQLLRALHGQLRAAIVDGRLKPGLRLPPTREMASIYRVSRNTVVAAYDLLLTEGYLTAQRLDLGLQVQQAAAQLADFLALLLGQAVGVGALLAQLENGTARLVVFEQRRRRHRTGAQAQRRGEGGRGAAPDGGTKVVGVGAHQR